MPRIKRKWSRVTAAEKRTCEMPSCENIAKERCKQFNCNQVICSEHKGAHSAVHTLFKQRGIKQGNPSTKADNA